MKNFLKNNLLSVLVTLSFCFTWASATTISRPYTSADYAGGAKAVGSKVNTEFQSIVDWLNGGNISTGNIADLGVTKAKLAALGQQASSSSGVFNSISTDATSVTNLSASITTIGRPVMVMLQSATTIHGGYIGFRNPTTNAPSGNVALIRDSSTVSLHVLTAGTFSSGGSTYVPCSAVSYMDTPSAGTYTYSVKIKSIVNSTTGVVEYCKLVVYEM